VSGRGRADALVPGARAVDTHGGCRVSIALLEDARLVASRDIPPAAHDIVDVVAKLCSTRTDAGADAELAVRDEFGPFVILQSVSETVAVQETSDGIALSVGTSVVKLAAVIAERDVEFGQVSSTGDLDIFGSLHKVDARKSAVRNEPRATAGLGAVRNGTALFVSNRCKDGRGEQTEIGCRIDPRCLTVRRLAGPSTAVVSAVLALLGGLRELVRHIAHVPNVVDVAWDALPSLDEVSIGNVSPAEVKTLPTIPPNDPVVACVNPLLIVVANEAGPDLHLDTIGGISFGNVEAFVPVDFDASVDEGPLLVIRASARLDADLGAVIIANGGHTFRIAETWLHEELPLESWDFLTIRGYEHGSQSC